MIDPTRQLPPHQGEPASGAQPFDMGAFAADLKSTPKQDYSAAWSDTPKTEAPPHTPKAEGASSTAPPGDAGHEPAGEESAKGEGSARETSRVFLLMYDNLVSQVCSAIADHDDYPAKRFRMDEVSRKEAEKQLAIGIEKNNWLNMPWWAILLAMVVSSGVANYLLIREANKAKKKDKEAAAERNREKAARGQTLHPDTITDREGRTVKTDPPPASPASAATRTAPPRTFGPCQAPGCNNQVKHRGRKYCSQSCAGKATAKRTTEPAPATA